MRLLERTSSHNFVNQLKKEFSGTFTPITRRRKRFRRDAESTQRTNPTDSPPFRLPRVEVVLRLKGFSL